GLPTNFLQGARRLLRGRHYTLVTDRTTNHHSLFSSTLHSHSQDHGNHLPLGPARPPAWPARSLSGEQAARERDEPPREGAARRTPRTALFRLRRARVAELAVHARRRARSARRGDERDHEAVEIDARLLHVARLAVHLDLVVQALHADDLDARAGLDRLDLLAGRVAERGRLVLGAVEAL